jgi:hypothetical protein
MLLLSLYGAGQEEAGRAVAQEQGLVLKGFERPAEATNLARVRL